MDQVHVIRLKVLVDGCSRRQVAKEFGISPVTVRKYVEGAAPVRRESQPRARPVWAQVGPRIEPLLASSKDWTGGKQQLTAVIIYLTGELPAVRLVFTDMSTPLPKTLIEAVKYFASPDNCREYLVARRWPNGVTCPTCGSTAVYFDSSRNGWECKTRHPQRKFTLKTGTIFEDSPLGFDKWLPAVWMIANCKNGVSSWELHRAIGVTQKTAWFMLQRIRLAMQDGETGGKLGGEVEVDETFIGGKARNMSPARKKRKGISQHTSMASKAAVMGLLERHPDKGRSKIRLQTLDNRKRHALLSEVHTHVEKGTTVHTDSLGSYVGLSEQGYVHNVIDHAEAYVNGNIHTNGCENFWSLLKRALKGTYIAVEPFHLFRYLDEQAFRFNNRSDTDAGRFSDVITSVVGRRLTYAELIAAADAGTA